MFLKVFVVIREYIIQDLAGRFHGILKTSA